MAAVGDGKAAQPDGATSLALAVVVATGGHDNLTYSLTNYTYAELAAATSEVLGTNRDRPQRPARATCRR